MLHHNPQGNEDRKNLLQRKQDPRSGAEEDRTVNGVLAGRILRDVRRKAPRSAACRPQCSRLLKQLGRG